MVSIICILSTLVLALLVCLLFSNSVRNRIACVDKEVELYRKEKELAVDKDIQDKVAENWQIVTQARHQTLKDQVELKEQEVKIKVEIAKLEGKQEALEVTQQKINKINEENLELLSSLLTKAIELLQSVKEVKIHKES